MKKKVGIVVVLLVIGFLFFLSKQKEGKLGELAKTLKVDKVFQGSESSQDKDDMGLDKNLDKAANSDTKSNKADSLDEKINGKSKNDLADKKNREADKGNIANKNKTTLDYKPGSKIPDNYQQYSNQEISDIKSYNQGKIDTVLPETRWSLKKNECKDLIKTKKGAAFTCRTRSSKKIGKAFIIHESSYDKNGKLIRFETKIQGVNEAISYHGPSTIRKSKGKRSRSQKSKEKAAKSIKFSLEDRQFYEVYLDENYMTKEVQYHYYDFKQAIITDEFYKEKDFRDRLDAVILSIEKTMKMVQDQCKLGQYQQACDAYKKYQKINLRRDAKKIISAAESAKLESAFFD